MLSVFSIIYTRPLNYSIKINEQITPIASYIRIFIFNLYLDWDICIHTCQVNRKKLTTYTKLPMFCRFVQRSWFPCDPGLWDNTCHLTTELLPRLCGPPPWGNLARCGPPWHTQGTRMQPLEMGGSRNGVPQMIGLYWKIRSRWGAHMWAVCDQVRWCFWKFVSRSTA